MKYVGLLITLAVLALMLVGCEKAEMLVGPELPAYDIVVGVANVDEHPSGALVTTLGTESGLVYVQLAQGETASLGWNHTRQVFIGTLTGTDVPVLNNAYFVKPVDYGSLRR